MFNKIYAVCLLVNDYERSLSFYKNLGFEVNSQDSKYADFKLGETLFAIFQKNEAIAMFPLKHMTTGGGSVLAFPVEDVAKTCKELTQKGIEIFEGPKTMAWGQTVAYFKDPDGNILEITS